MGKDGVPRNFTAAADLPNMKYNCAGYAKSKGSIIKELVEEHLLVSV